jgi:MraZ protein
VAETTELILGENARTLDDRYRVSLPSELVDQLAADKGACILAKEQYGCLSLWNADAWQAKQDEGVALVASKIQAGRLEGRLLEVQLLGRLLSTRQTQIKLAGRGRIVLPEGFREFLAVEPGGTVMIIGAAVCIEIWHPERWQQHIAEQMPEFRQVFDQLSA